MTENQPETVEPDAPPEELDSATLIKLLPGASGASSESMMRDRCVTRADMKRFLAESPPRQIPQGMKIQVLGDNRAFAAFGIFFTVVVLTMMIILVFVADEELTLEQFGVFTVIGLVPVLVTTAILTYRRQQARVLRRGILTTGVVMEARQCEWDSSEGKPHWVTVKFQLNDREQTVSLHIYGQAGEVAMRYAESGQETNVLVDPLNHKRIVCPDLLDIFEVKVLKAAEARGRPYKYRPM